MRSLRKRIADVQDGYLDLENVARMEIPAEDLPRHALRPGDVLMNQGGDFEKLGRGHVWDGQIDPCITQNHVPMPSTGGLTLDISGRLGTR